MAADKTYRPTADEVSHNILQVPANKILFFTQDLAHGGVTYLKPNVRFFISFDHKDVPPEENAAYTLQHMFDGRAAALEKKHDITHVDLYDSE